MADPGERATGRKSPAPEPVTHLFQVQLFGEPLKPEQLERIAVVIREAAADGLRAVDFQIDELAPLFRKGAGTVATPCGSGCRTA